MKFFLTICILALTAFGQTKTVKVGTEKKLDYPARSAKEGVDLRKKAAKTRSNAEKSKLNKQALVKYEEALAHLDAFVKEPAKDPKGKYQNGKDKKWRVTFMKGAAKTAAASQNFSKADKYFAELTTNLDKDNARIWYDYGVYLYSRSKKSIAKNAFDNAIKFAGKDLTANDKKKLAIAKRYTSRSYYKLGDIANDATASIRNYKKAIEFNKNYWQAYLKMGKSYETSKAYAGMLDSYNNVIRIMKMKRGGKNVVSTRTRIKQLARATMFKGVAEYYTKKYSNAIKTLKSVDKIKGAKGEDKNSANYHLGLAYKAQGSTKNAIAYFKKTKGDFKKSADWEIDGLTKDYSN